MEAVRLYFAIAFWVFVARYPVYVQHDRRDAFIAAFASAVFWPITIVDFIVVVIAAFDDAVRAAVARRADLDPLEEEAKKVKADAEEEDFPRFETVRRQRARGSFTGSGK